MRVPLTVCRYLFPGGAPPQGGGPPGRCALGKYTVRSHWDPSGSRLRRRTPGPPIFALHTSGSVDVRLPRRDDDDSGRVVGADTLLGGV